MGYPVALAIRYLSSKRSAAFVSVGTAFAMLGVTLGVAALATVMSVTGGFQQQFREKVLGVNAHVLVLKYSIDFREYRDVMKKVEDEPHVIGVAPFVISAMMVTHGDRTATGVLVKGVDPILMPKVLDLPKNLTSGSLDGLRKAGAHPPERSALDNFRSTGDIEAFSPLGLSPPHAQFNVNDAGAAAIAPDLSDDILHHDSDADAGRERLLDAIRKQIDADKALDDARDAGAFKDSYIPPSVMTPPPPATDVTPTLPKGAPEGDVTPTGGFASKLPDDDALPDSIDPDPCKSPEQVKALPGVVVGRTLMTQLGMNLGDCLQITSPTIGLSIGAAGTRPPLVKRFRVIATFEAGFDQYDSKLVYTDLYEAQAFYEQGDSVTGVEMKVDDIDKAAAIAKDIDAKLGNSVYHTMDWSDLNHGLFTALLIQQILMSVVLALIIVVAAFTVVATLIMVVLDKRKEIALLKALGAKDDAILRVFLYQGGIIGLVGTATGLLVGLICCKGLLAYGFPLDPKVYFINKLPVLVRPTEFLVTGGIAILICLLATIFPALYAARLRPSDGFAPSDPKKMRWHVEASLGLANATGNVGAIDSDATVEADSWQRALQAARVLRGERTPMSGFSIEALPDGTFRAADPIKKITFVVRPAGDDATLGMHKAPTAASSNVRMNIEGSGSSADVAGATLLDAVPPPANLPLDSLDRSSGQLSEDPTVPLLPALDPDATDETMATMPLPSASALEPVILFRREQSPSPAAPLHYREYVLALPTGTTEDEAEVVLRRELARVKDDLATELSGKLVNLAAFDEMFTGPPTSLPLVTLTWKDWRGEPVIDRPRLRGSALPVQPMSFPPPAPPSAPEVLHVEPMPPMPAVPAFEPEVEPAIEPAIERPIEPATAAVSEDPVDVPGDVPEPKLPAMRRQADSLIPVLFEQMHELAFLKDSIEGAEFCLTLALQELPALAGVVHLYDMERRVFEVIAVRGEAADGRLHTLTPDGDPRFRTAAREGVARGQSDAPPRARSDRPASLTHDGDSVLAPIVKDGRYLGAIELVGSKDGEPLGDGETNALTYIAGQYAEFVSSRGTKFKASVGKIASRPPTRGR